MSIFVFFAILVVVYFIVKIGGAAFELTGLKPDQARFQALSAFTQTGFTTKEAELIVTHSQRRKIASWLMIFGNAGLVTLVATLVSTINTEKPSTLLIPVIDQHLPGFMLPYAHLAILLIFLLLVYLIFTRSSLSKILFKKVQQQMVSKKIIHPVSFEEFLLTAEGYGVSQVEITRYNPLKDKSLAESQLREHDILVLSIEREDDHLLNPSPRTKFMVGDKLICFGRLTNIRELAYEESNKKL